MNTNHITTAISDTELTNVGRAMERKGFDNIDDFLRWLVTTQTEAILHEK
jgi:hypothetical protein